jgi:hypothetical protein
MIATRKGEPARSGPVRQASTDVKIMTRVIVAALSVFATASFSMIAPASAAGTAAGTPLTAKALEASTTCMTAHQAWVWEQAILSIPAIVTVPPRICPS